MTASLNEEGISAYFVLFSALLALVLILSKLLHDRPRLASLLPEAGMILIVGVVVGALIEVLFNPESNNSASQQQQQQQGQQTDDTDDQAVDEEVAASLLSFSDEVFFLFLLPPIIFNSGYHLRKELFFRHITPIILFAVVGTTISAFSVAFFMEFVHEMGWIEGREDFHPTFTELLTFGALISATDPVSTLAVFQVKRVDPQLFYLVFGESVLNDAVVRAGKTNTPRQVLHSFSSPSSFNRDWCYSILFQNLSPKTMVPVKLPLTWESLSLASCMTVSAAPCWEWASASYPP